MNSETSPGKPASQPRLEAVDKEKKWCIASKIAALFAICIVVLPVRAILVAKSNVPATPRLGWPILISSTRQGTTDIQFEEEKCDISMGKWVRDPVGPIYTAKTYPYNQCQIYGKDPGYLYWRWQPYGCQLPRFVPGEIPPNRAGETARLHRRLAGAQSDGVPALPPVAGRDAHGHPRRRRQSADMALPQTRLHGHGDGDAVPRASRAPVVDADGQPTASFDIHLDRLDAIWRSRLPELDFAVISSGSWFFRANYFWEGGRRVGCGDANLTDFGTAYAVRRVVRAALEGVARCEDCKPSLVTFVRTSAPSHFEHGSWFDGGYCNRTRPSEEGEISMESTSSELRKVQIDEVRKMSGSKRFGVLNVTKAVTLRPDGHPNWHLPKKSAGDPNDCLHWCLPGPVDMWNDVLLQRLAEISSMSAVR